MRFPPYGKEILAMRTRGQHPDRVVVAFSKQWKRSEDFPFIFVPASDYEKGNYDFSILAGLYVEFVMPYFMGDQCYDLVAEIGSFASIVSINWVGNNGKWCDELLSVFLYDPCLPSHWRGGWSDQLDLDYNRRFETLCSFYESSQEVDLNHG